MAIRSVVFLLLSLLSVFGQTKAITVNTATGRIASPSSVVVPSGFAFSLDSGSTFIANTGLTATYTSPSYQMYGHVLESASGSPGACQNTLRVTNLAGFQTDNNYYSAIAVTDPVAQSQTTFGYGNDSSSLLPWRRNGYIEEWCGPSGTYPLPGFVHVQTSAAGSFLRQQILSDGTNPGDQLFYNGKTFNTIDGQQLRLVTDGTVIVGNNSTGALLTIGGKIGATTSSGGTLDSTLAFNGAVNAPAISTKPGLYHRAGVGLGVFADAQISFQVNGATSLSEAARFTASGNFGIDNTNPQSALAVGSIGIVKEISAGMQNSFARFRERDSADNLEITTNINYLGAVDDAALPSWKTSMGSLDYFSVERATPGSSSFVQLFAVTASGVAKMTPLTVSTLPSASSNAGAIAYVTDATSWAANTVPTGGGSTKVMVFSNGTSWLMK